MIRNYHFILFEMDSEDDIRNGLETVQSSGSMVRKITDEKVSRLEKEVRNLRKITYDQQTWTNNKEIKMIWKRGQERRTKLTHEQCRFC